MTPEELVASGWQRHAADPEGVLATLAQHVGAVTTPAHVAAVAGLTVHVAGEHLGRWADGLALLGRLEALPAFDPTSAEGKALRRGQAALQRCAGDLAAFERSLAAARTGGAVPEASDRARVLATAAAALAGRGRPRDAGMLLDEALRLTAYGPKADDPAARALAVTGNNLAAELEGRLTRSADEDALMVRAAEVGLRYWTLVGGWEQVQAAHYRLSHSLRKAGRPREALAAAHACRDLVAAHGSPPAETFFAHEAAAHALAAIGDRAGAARERAAAAALLTRIDDEDWRAAAASDLAALDAALAPGA